MEKHLTRSALSLIKKGRIRATCAIVEADEYHSLTASHRGRLGGDSNSRYQHLGIASKRYQFAGPNHTHLIQHHLELLDLVAGNLHSGNRKFLVYLLLSCRLRFTFAKRSFGVKIKCQLV